MEASLSFLVKDRHLDDTKRRWIKANVRKRECVSFSPVAQTADGPVLCFNRRIDPEEDQTTLCRCGRQLRQHVKDGEFVRSRDYRLFSEEFPTDVYVETVNTAENKRKPITYAPKQVVRLSADSEPDVLRQLIGQVWRMPKASFLVSLHGSCEPGQRRRLSDNLKQLLTTLSNPGSTILTISSSDPRLYRLALESCKPVADRQLPSAEIVPVVFLQWSQLTEEEKGVLLEVTAVDKAAEDCDISSKVAALDSWKGYFLLTDYGVHAETGPDSADSDTLTESFGRTCDTDEFHQESPEWTTPFSALREPGETEALRNSTPHPLQPDGNNSRAKAEAEEGWDVPDRSKEPDSNEVKETDPLVAMNGYAPPESKPSPQQLNTKDEEITTTSESEPDEEEDRHEVAQDTGPHQRDYRTQARREPISDRGDDVDRTDVSRGRMVPEVNVLERYRPGHATSRMPSRRKLFNFSFPNPLRRRVETILQEHTHDPQAHGSLMILADSSSFLDLAAVHGAIFSGVPVIIIKSTSGANSILLNLLEEMDRRESSQSTDLVPDGRPLAVDDNDLERLIQSYGRQLTDYDRFQGQMFRVARDILAHRHLLTICDIDHSHTSIFDNYNSRLVAATVEAFIKSLSKEEAVVFFTKNTLRLAAEEDDHPVKKAQREFQCATLEAAVKLDRPELLDIIVRRGFVKETDVFGSYGQKFLSDEEQKVLLTGESLPISEIKDLQHFQFREFFVEHVCKLTKGSDHLSVIHRLFVYTILNGRTELAKHFWMRSLFQDQVANALIASHVSSYLALKSPPGRQANVFQQQAVEFQGLAQGTLNDCYVQDPKRGCAIVMETAAGFPVSPIEAAILYDIRAFVAEPASSDYLDSVWAGVQDQTSSHRQSSKKKTTEKRTCSPCVAFLTAPRTKCFVSTFFYVLFLALYSHTLIFESGKKELTPFDMTLLVWALSFLVEELMQFLNPSSFLKTSKTEQRTVKGLAKAYFSDTWNILDIVALLLFVLGYVLRLTLEVAEAGHVVLSVDLLLFFFRLLRVLTVSRSIGPMLPMIWNMLGDLIPFLVILFVFVLAYAVASEALLHPGTSWSALYLLYLPRVGFWPIFGEYGMDTIDGVDCATNSLWYAEGGGDVTCPSRAGRHVVPVLMGLYILITNVLMLNLLIAYFNHSFERVHKESNVWWAWLRCGLIGEFYGHPPVPPPFTLLYRALQAVLLLVAGVCGVCEALARCVSHCFARCCRKREGALSLQSWEENRRGGGDIDYLMTFEADRREVNPVEAFMEDGDVLDAIDLEEFRFSELGHQPDRWGDFERSQAPPRTDSPSTSMPELKKWEASKASAYVMSQAPPSEQALTQRSSKGKKGKAEMEDILNRLEKKTEDNKELLKALTALLSNAHSALSSAPEGEVPPPDRHDNQDDAAQENETGSETV